jgi:hypothetical protein
LTPNTFQCILPKIEQKEKNKNMTKTTLVKGTLQEIKQYILSNFRPESVVLKTLSDGGVNQSLLSWKTLDEKQAGEIDYYLNVCEAEQKKSDRELLQSLYYITYSGDFSNPPIMMGMEVFYFAIKTENRKVAYNVSEKMFV